MEETKTFCDICRKEFIRNGRIRMQVIFETEQNEGRAVKAYFGFENLDLCDNCKKEALRGNYIFASGAMGHNDFYFKK